MRWCKLRWRMVRWGAKLAGAGGTGGTIIVLTLQPERTLNALREVADQIIPIAPSAPGLIAC
jgi:hypothetical protein